MRFSIENEIAINDGNGYIIVEIFDKDTGIYDYYIYLSGYPFCHVFGVQEYDRLSTEELTNLYFDGYFDTEIEHNFC